MEIKIGNKKIGGRAPCYIIAEVGSNHDGSINTAKEYIRKASEIGADCVKFQLFNPKKLAEEKNKEYQDILEKIKLLPQWIPELKRYAEKNNIDFMVTPFDEESARTLNNNNIQSFKISSSDLNNISLIEEVASFKKPIILSTGMGNIEEIGETVNKIKEIHNKIILLHCVASYPSPIEEANINAMVSLRNEFNLIVGYSDHSLGSLVPIVAVSLGAKVIEKHITKDRKLPGPDHSFAMEFDEFKEMIKQIRQVEAALGNGKKKHTKSEEDGLINGRRSIFSLVEIKEGELITKDKLKFVRPGTGMPPNRMGEILGKKATKIIPKDTMITQYMIEQK